jgi:3-methylcrotonyl-CoA carboxylase alpha subunit
VRHRLILDGEPHDVWLVRDPTGDRLLRGDRSTPIRTPIEAVVVVDGDTVHIHHDGRSHSVRYEDPLVRFAGEHATAAADVARAPMPGVVVAVLAAPGDTVAGGTVLMIIESMKMETTIRASRDGVVDVVMVGVGQTFDRDAILVTLVAEDETCGA